MDRHSSCYFYRCSVHSLPVRHPSLSPPKRKLKTSNRCMRARQNTGHATWRAMLLPKKGIDVKIPYGPHIKVAPPPCLPTPSPSPATTNSPRRPRVPRGRSSRRAARGPDIGEGGRRITSSGPDLEDGGSIYDYDELPAYGGDHRPPAYAGVWSQTTGATPPTNDMLDAQQYEMRTRGATRMRTDSAVSVVEPTRPEAARVARGSVFPELRHHHHRDSVASVASTSADTIRASPSLDKDDLLASPKNKTFKRDEAR